MKWWLLFFIFFTFNTLLAEEKNEIEDFADKYLETLQDKLSSENFKVVLDVKNSEVVFNKQYGAFKYKFNEYHIDEGKMIIEKNYNNINFQLLSNTKNPMFSINYKITFK